jgi:tRNA(adenine34) deaminase
MYRPNDSSPTQVGSAASLLAQLDGPANHDHEATAAREGDEAMMRLALEQAHQAAAADEVPVGAVVVRGGQIIARAHNRRESHLDPLAHAELLAIRAAAQHLGRWRLFGCTLYSTLEPCPMCAGAIVNARLDRLVFAAHDGRGGAVGSLMNLVRDPRLNHRAEVTHGVLAAPAAELLRSFFKARRSASAERAEVDGVAGKAVAPKEF